MNTKKEMQEHVMRLQDYIIKTNERISWCMDKITDQYIEIIELRKDVKKLNDRLNNNG